MTSPTTTSPITPGPVALLGSGEFLPVMTETDRRLLADRSPTVCHLSTAAAPEGAASLTRWTSLGREHVESRLGATYRSCGVIDRATADDDEYATMVDDTVGLIYLSGGDPGFLAETLDGTSVWTAIVDCWRSGAALAGCSAGAMVLGGMTASPRRQALLPALGLYEHLVVIPHFDRIAGAGDLVDRLTAQAGDGHVVLGIDEDTAVVGDDTGWQVTGRQSVRVLGENRSYAPGERVDLPFAWDGSPS